MQKKEILNFVKLTTKFKIPSIKPFEVNKTTHLIKHRVSNVEYVFQVNRTIILTQTMSVIVRKLIEYT